MYRISYKHLDALVEKINKKKGFNSPKYSEPGSYTLSGAYGGVALHQYCNEAGGVNDVFSSGHIPKRDLYNRMRAFLQGLES
jgi:hypothetical protein